MQASIEIISDPPPLLPLATNSLLQFGKESATGEKSSAALSPNGKEKEKRREWQDDDRTLEQQDSRKQQRHSYYYYYATTKGTVRKEAYWSTVRVHTYSCTPTATTQSPPLEGL